MLTPLWTLSHQGDYGIGDLASLRKFIPWVAEAKIDFLQLLPINETDQSNSPYSAISSIALDPVYLDLSLIAELEDLPQASIPARSQTVDYSAVRAIKTNLLRQGFRKFYVKDLENPEFEKFRAREAEWLHHYSAFRWLMDQEGGSSCWSEWSESYNTPAKALEHVCTQLAENPDDVEPDILYYEWLQWHADKQWKSIRKFSDEHGVKLMGDIPVGVSYNSADVFFEPENFQLDRFGGAPPETFFKDDPFAIKWGQNWGVPLYNDDYLRETQFAWWQRRVRKHTEIFSMFRIDHVLGLYRFYSFPWHPSRNDEFLPLSEQEAADRTGGQLPGFFPASDDDLEHAQRNLERGHEILAYLKKAAGNAEIIGEDLGVVPHYVRPHLEEIQISGFRICHWEADSLGKPCKPTSYPYYSFSTFSTHDHPPLPLLWEEYRLKLDSHDKTEQLDAMRQLKILSLCAGQPLPTHILSSQDVPAFDSELLWKLLEFQLMTGSRYTAFQITDLLGECSRYNTPSTMGNHNWTHRVGPTVEDFLENETLQQIQEDLAFTINLYRPQN